MFLSYDQWITHLSHWQTNITISPKDRCGNTINHTISLPAMTHYSIDLGNHEQSEELLLGPSVIHHGFSLSTSSETITCYISDTFVFPGIDCTCLNARRATFCSKSVATNKTTFPDYSRNSDCVSEWVTVPELRRQVFCMLNLWLRRITFHRRVTHPVLFQLRRTHTWSNCYTGSEKCCWRVFSKPTDRTWRSCQC